MSVMNKSLTLVAYKKNNINLIVKQHRIDHKFGIITSKLFFFAIIIVLPIGKLR